MKLVLHNSIFVLVQSINIAPPLRFSLSPIRSNFSPSITIALFSVKLLFVSKELFIDPIFIPPPFFAELL